MAENQLVLFVDANIFIDVATKRKGWEASLELISELRKSANRGFISLLTAAIIYYTFLSRFSPKESVQEMEKLVKGFTIVDLSQEDFEKALRDDRLQDFEDRLQFYAAKKVCKTMVTRNKKDYRKAENEISIASPEDILVRYQSPHN